MLGREFGDMIRALHESKGVVFHLGNTVTNIATDSVTLKDGATVGADLVVIGAGVRPNVALADSGGLKVDKGVVVNEFLETNVPGIFAAGDIARWPDKRFGGGIRVEHWVVAERQGQRAAQNMLAGAAARKRFEAVPFFWSRHYDLQIQYVGHAEKWDKIDISGDLGAHDATVAYRAGGRTLAVATTGGSRDLASLQAEVALEQGAEGEIEALLR